MLELTVRDGEDEVVLQFEHSLLAVSKWESKYKKPFMSKAQKTPTELIDYFGDMILTPGVNPLLVYRLTPEQMDELAKYMNDSPTASSVPDDPQKSSGEQVTSELIYYWLSELKIPFAVETWHLARLMMLIQITNLKRQPPKKRPVADTMANWMKLNEERKKKFNTNG